MSCGAGKPNFRLLDAYVGWDDIERPRSQLTGFDDPAGIHLDLINTGAVNPVQVLAYLPAARLARGCGACEWYLVTPFPPRSRLLRRDACHRDWTPVWADPQMADALEGAVAIATWQRSIAVSDHRRNRVSVWAQSGRRLVAEIHIHQPGVIAFTPRGELLVASAGKSQLARFGLDGITRGAFPATLPDQPNRIAVDRKNRVWIVTGDRQDSWKLWRAAWLDTEFKLVNADELSSAFASTGIVAESEAGFCFSEIAQDGQAVTSCFSWCGHTIDAGAITPPKPPAVQAQGQLLTQALDSGAPRCRWHRVRVDADVPKGTTLSVAVATAEDPTLNQGEASRRQGNVPRDPAWQAFPAGDPHFSDWSSAPAGSLDFLIQQPPGRYLYLRVRFTSGGTATPRVRRVRIDFPRVTSLENLPDVYRETPKAEDFTERFLSLFDSSVADVDRVIERYPALLDPSGVPAQVLPWLGGFFDIGFDPTWEPDKRRKILQAAPQLYRQRGTLAGLQQAIELVFGVKPAIEELSPTGAWGALSSRNELRFARCDKRVSRRVMGRAMRVGRSRLFGKARARFRLNSSPLGGAPLRGYGNPDLDPFASGAYRLRVLVPSWPNMAKGDRDRITNLLESQKPAHTVVSVRVGGIGFLLGKWAAVGVDTAFVPLARPILGRNGNVRLNRMSILWGTPGGRPTGLVLGRTSVVGSQIIAG